MEEREERKRGREKEREGANPSWPSSHVVNTCPSPLARALQNPDHSSLRGPAHIPMRRGEGDGERRR